MPSFAFNSASSIALSALSSISFAFLIGAYSSGEIKPSAPPHFAFSSPIFHSPSLPPAFAGSPPAKSIIDLLVTVVLATLSYKAFLAL